MIPGMAALAGYEVIALVRHDGQVEAAKQLGAAHVVQTTNTRKAILETRALTPKNRGVDIAIEAVGVPEACRQEAVELVRKRRHGEFLWRLRRQHARHSRHESHSLQRHNPPCHLPPHIGYLPQGA